MPSSDLEAQVVGLGPMYALLDAARSPAVLERLKESGEIFESLYAGRRARQLADVAPYIAQVSTSVLLEALAVEGRGQSWGVICTAPAPLAEVRRHVRRFLTIETEDGEALAFRFYDPRVLRPYLTSASEDVRRAFFGPVTSFFVEDSAPGRWIRFDRVGPPMPAPSPPWDLPLVRDEQAEVFARELTDAFVDREVTRLGADLMRWATDAADARATVVEAMARANGHDVVSTGDVVRYLDLVVRLGPRFDERLPWAREILSRDELEPDQKLARLERKVRFSGRARKA